MLLTSTYQVFNENENERTKQQQYEINNLLPAYQKNF